MLPFILGALFGWLLVYVLYPFLNKDCFINLFHEVLSGHARGGGISFVLVSFVCSLLRCWMERASMPLRCSSRPLAVVGLYDDLCSLPKSWRYVVHLSTGAFILGITPLVHQIFQLPFQLF